MDAVRCTLYVGLLLVMTSLPARSQTFYDQENTLRTVLLTNYKYKIRPEALVTCNVRLSLLNINVLDVPSQSLSVSGWLTVKWNDTRLVWDPTSNGNITDIYDTELVFWRPEMIVDNSISNLGVIESDKLLIRATSEGEMTWEPSGIFETHCDVDVTYYPFDTQTCEIQVTSWAYTKEEVDLYPTDAEVYLADFSPNGEWEIINTWSERKELTDGDDTHSQVDFVLKLRRLPRYYVMTILIPVIVTSLLCVLVFLLPSESGEKVGYTLTILLTYTVMLTLVASYMPPTSKTTSVLSVYLTIILFVGVISTLVTVIGLYFYHHLDTPIHPLLLVVFQNVFIPCVRWKHKPTAEGGSSETSSDEVHKANINMAGNKVYPDSLSIKRKFSSSSQEQKPSGNDVTEHELTWQDLSVILDSFFFRVMGVAVVLLTLIVILILLIAGYS